jgi:hypothetical protein
VPPGESTHVATGGLGALWVAPQQARSQLEAKRGLLQPTTFQKHVHCPQHTEGHPVLIGHVAALCECLHQLLLAVGQRAHRIQYHEVSKAVTAVIGCSRFVHWASMATRKRMIHSLVHVVTSQKRIFYPHKILFEINRVFSFFCFRMLINFHGFYPKPYHLFLAT